MSEQIAIIKEVFGKMSDKELDKEIKSKKWYIDYNNRLVKQQSTKINACGQRLFIQFYYDTNNHDIKRLYTRFQVVDNYDIDSESYTLLTKEEIKKALQFNLDNLDLKTFIYKKACFLFGEDRVDIDNNLLTIYYPKITIKNKNGLEHDMLDVYATIEIRSNKARLYYISRGTLTSSEIREGYLFSHVSWGWRNSPRSSDICFGTNENPVLKLMDNEKSDNIRNVEQWLLALEFYLNWESLEGVPYRFISNVKADKNFYTSASRVRINDDIILDVYNTITPSLSLLDYEFNHNLELKLTDNSKNQITNLIKEKYGDKYFAFTIDGANVRVNPDYTYEKLVQAYARNGNDYVLTFKGEEKKLNIINTDPINDSSAKSIDSNLLNSLCLMYETKILNHLYVERYKNSQKRSL